MGISERRLLLGTATCRSHVHSYGVMNKWGKVSGPSMSPQ